MGYGRDDHRGGRDDRWRERGGYGERGYGRSNQDHGGNDRDRGDDRGFFERAGEQVRSWFGDDDDDHGRRERSEYRGGGDYERQRGRERMSGQGGDRYGDFTSAGGGGGGGADTWGGSGFGGDHDRGRRFDRIDAGSTGTHGAHPMSSPVGGAYGGGYGVSAEGGGGASSARYAAMSRGGQDRGQSQQRKEASDLHDRHYSEWRQRQIDELDRDYHDYRRENQSRFEQEFGGWRQKRQGQRQSMGKVAEHMEVVGSDGQHIGTVDKVRGDRIILTKNDQNAGGHHHSIPCSWIESVDDKLTVNKTAEQAMQAWRDEENNRALFERQDQGEDGPHMLNRSFSHTYGRDD